MRLPPTNQLGRPRLVPPPLRVLEQVGLVSPFGGESQGRSRGAATQNHLPAARPRLQRALPATLRRGAGPDTAALSLGKDRTNHRLPSTPADPRSGFVQLGLAPIARARSPGFSSQSDTEAEQAAGKATPPKEGEGGRTPAQEPLSLTLPSPRREADRARTFSSLPTPPTYPPHPGGNARVCAAAHSRGR